MSNNPITLPNGTIGGDIRMHVTLRDAGLAVDWNTVQVVKAYLYSTDQKSIAGECETTINASDPKDLICDYSANKPQYLGVNRIIVRCVYLGRQKTYDAAAINLVASTDDLAGEPIVMDDPEVDVEIKVEDVNTSLLDEAISAAVKGAAAAQGIADAHVGPAAGFGLVTASVDDGYGTPAVDVETSGDDQEKNFDFQFRNLKGNGISDIDVEESDEDGGTNEVTVNMEDGTSTSFGVKNGHKGDRGPAGVESVVVNVDNTTGTPSGTATVEEGVMTLNLSHVKGEKGDRGDSGYQGAADELEIVNNDEEGGETAGWSAERGKVIREDVTALEHTVDGYEREVETAQTLTANKYYNLSGDTLPTATSSSDGCYCIKKAVTPGEKYKISGYKGDSTALRQWATADSDYGKKRRAATSQTLTRVTVEITIEEDEAWLYVNLKNYDAQTDGVWKMTEEHVDGLADRVEELEARAVPSVADSLDSTSTTDALSANKGRVLNEDINGVTTETTTPQEILEYKYFNTSNSRVPSRTNLASASATACVYLYVSEGEVYRIYGKGNSGSTQLYAMADADRYVVENGTPGVAMNTRTNPLDLTIPAGVAILVVNLYQYDSTTDKVLKVGHVTSSCVKTRIAALEQADNELAALALPLKGKKVMFFGDSVTDFTYNGKGLTNYFAEASLATCFKAAIGGTRFVQRTTPVASPTTSAEAYAALDICNMVRAWCEADYDKQDAATTYLNDHTARVNALKNNPIGEVDIVCIGGGTNDMTAGSPIGSDADNTFDTIKGSINKMVELLLTANPKLKIYFYSPVVGYHGSGGRTNENWDDNYHFSSGLTKPEYIDIFAARAKANHIPYINMYWTLGWNQVNFSNYYLDTDDHHPYKGFDVIGRRLYQQVLANLE